MRWGLLLVGLLLGFVGGAGSIIYLQMHNGSESSAQSIVFAPKNYYDSDAFVAVSGTLTGPDMTNNTYSITCFQEAKQCWIASVDAIGAQQIGRMDGPYSFDIRSWSKNEIISGYDAPFGCFKTTVTISRSSKDVLWLEEPVNQSKPFCKDAKNETRKFTIEDSPGWKKIHDATKNR